MKLSDLIGNKVLSAKISPDNMHVVLDTTQGPVTLSWYGDCCAHCFLANASGIDNLIGATIASIENMEWQIIKDDKDDYDVIESMGTKITTDKGYVTLESRVVHNGYYGGWIEVETGLPQNYDEYKTLEDF